MHNTYEILSSNNKIKLNDPIHKGPLSLFLKKKMRTHDLKRMKRFSSLLDAFHLKNTITTDITGRNIIVNEKLVKNFSSANYLGFDQHPEVIKAAIAGIEKLGNHSGSSRIFSSHLNIIELENEISNLVGSQKSLICANVSQTHSGAIPALFSGENCEIFIDRFAHSSLYQASLIAKARGTTLSKVNVANLEQLQQVLHSSSKETKVLLIDGLYSMQGNIPDILAIQKICNDSNTILYIDDAHGIGIYGDNGGGVAELLKLKFDNLILVGSFQKGFGCFGAFITGSESLIDFLRVTSKAYIFSGPIQPQAVEATRAAIKISKSDEGRSLREVLHAKSRHIRQALVEMNFKVLDPEGNSPIISIEMGSDLRTLMAGKTIFDQGVYLNSVMYPAVPKDQGILRISLNAIHSNEDIDALLQSFKYLKKELDHNYNGLTENFKYFMRIARAKLMVH